jgi:uncharacterized membrane protein
LIVNDINNDGMIAGGVLDWDQPPPRPAMIWNWDGTTAATYRIGRWYAVAASINGQGTAVGHSVNETSPGSGHNYNQPLVF